MFIFKLKPEDSGYMPFTALNFEKASNKKPPYYKPTGKESFSHYAVCPACNNPVVIIGLYDKEHPFARHHTHSVTNLAAYDADNFNFCPLANPGKSFPIRLRRNTTELSKKIIRLLRDNFDVVVKMIGLESGIKISANLAAKMLGQYMAQAGYRYLGATLLNVPWAFAYLTVSNSLFMQYLYTDKPLYKYIQKNFPDIKCSKDGQITGTGGGDLSFKYIGHVSNSYAQESYTFEVAYQPGHDAPLQIIFAEKITFDLDKFQRLIQPNRKITESGERLLDIAKKILPDDAV